jgi:hypothetical protein
MATPQPSYPPRQPHLLPSRPEPARPGVAGRTLMLPTRMDAFDFNQTPLPPLVLKKRLCL